MALSTWERLAASYRAKQLEAIPASWRLTPEQKVQLSLHGHGSSIDGRLIASGAVSKAAVLSNHEIDITENYDAADLVKKIAQGALSAVEVTVAFCKRAAIAQQMVSCLTEIYFEEAMQRARFLDQYVADNGHTLGPLHGLPISLKDSFQLKGGKATLGFITNLTMPAAENNSALVDLLLDAGCVVYCKTNIPQTMMTADSENNIFGRTLNPHKTALTAGGSSGGEGALLAMRGSPLGVGTDIAGSIRIPALCCGTYGFKPTADRIPYGGQASLPFPKPEFEVGIKVVAGPLANSLQDLEMFMKIVLGSNPGHYDTSAITEKWRTVENGSNGSITIGVLSPDPEYILMPPVRRAMDEAIAKLQAAGHNIVHLPFEYATSAGLGGRIAFQWYGLLSVSGSLEDYLGEPLVRSVARNVHPFSKHAPPVEPSLDQPSLLKELRAATQAYEKAWENLWQTYALDVILSPASNTTAVPHDTYGVPVYTCMWNVLDVRAHHTSSWGVTMTRAR
ncbi:hypothetical protein FPSE_05720 [Fusarium pseudograminearum CS3096]|uniref:amidase n=1 Tax=Fusarium pseudograminearum (strain CS3096) TaxID=1028729 RepID=K3W0H0_FUSPC|nr:hypothetical protein FPSE_05720 [Fusarium pseudograminearum CS3096]EKJ74135.1 hypothetical protein FPSE_05720 [Fusarium pseudograminearum CS3096]